MLERSTRVPIPSQLSESKSDKCLEDIIGEMSSKELEEQLLSPQWNKFCTYTHHPRFTSEEIQKEI